ncbi:endonuclease/exonuclease/phosphatase family protein [Pedobacter sp. GR22-6]|uniref:endonuclease/exonuclease/phosphatase family protein n=1 Tax=Pedobacter sp. GR22-6 TaxID=3127957 RepID=UPI00307F3031
MLRKTIFSALVAFLSISLGCKKIYQIEESHTYESVTKAPETGTPTGNATEIRVMSYDINYTNRAIKGTNTGVLDIDAVADVINSNKPDVVCMRQVDRYTTRGQMDIDQAAALGSMTGLKYYYAAARVIGQGSSGNAILSRFPILSSENLKLFTDPADEARCAAIAVLDLGSGRKLKVMSTQLEAAKENNRLKELEEIQSKLKSDDTPFVLAGNMTANVGTATFNKLNEYFVLYTKDTPLATFSYPNPTTIGDYIFYSSDSHFKVENYYLAGYTPNRHVPLIVNFQLKY